MVINKKKEVMMKKKNLVYPTDFQKFQKQFVTGDG